MKINIDKNSLPSRNQITHVLNYLGDVLKIGEKWIVGGSTASFLQGVNIIPRDIDILTTKKGAFEIEKKLQKYVKKSVKLEKTKKYVSYFGKLKIQDIYVEICGELYIIYRGRAFPFYPPFIKEKEIYRDGKKLLTVSLENQLWINLLEDKEERAKLIAKYLKKTGFDRDYMKRIMSNSTIPSEIKLKVKSLLKSKW